MDQDSLRPCQHRTCRVFSDESLPVSSQFQKHELLAESVPRNKDQRKD